MTVCLPGSRRCKGGRCAACAGCRRIGIWHHWRMVDRGTVRLGLIACGELPERLARQLVEDLSRALAERVCSDLAWELHRVTDALAADPGSDGTEMVDAARRRMLREG